MLANLRYWVLASLLYENYLKMFGYPTLVYIGQEQYIRKVGGYLGQNALADKLDQILNEN